jgi:hypothetical protein
MIVANDQGMTVKVSVKSYMTHPGPVIASDGDLHVISSPQLIRLYQVPYQRTVTCLFCSQQVGRCERDNPAFIHLWPRAGGRYSL